MITARLALDHLLWAILGNLGSLVAASNELISFQTKQGCLCKSISPFPKDLYGISYDYICATCIYITNY